VPEGPRSQAVASRDGCLLMQVLQLVEQILKGPEQLLDAAVPELAPDSHLGALLSDLCRQLSTDPAPGQIIRRVVASAATAVHVLNEGQQHRAVYSRRTVAGLACRAMHPCAWC
jgi:hypothetical protein